MYNRESKLQFETHTTKLHFESDRPSKLIHEEDRKAERIANSKLIHTHVSHRRNEDGSWTMRVEKEYHFPVEAISPEVAEQRRRMKKKLVRDHQKRIDDMANNFNQY